MSVRKYAKTKKETVASTLHLQNDYTHRVKHNTIDNKVESQALQLSSDYFVYYNNTLALCRSDPGENEGFSPIA